MFFQASKELSFKLKKQNSKSILDTIFKNTAFLYDLKPLILFVWIFFSKRLFIISVKDVQDTDVTKRH